MRTMYNLFTLFGNWWKYYNFQTEKINEIQKFMYEARCIKFFRHLFHFVDGSLP